MRTQCHAYCEASGQICIDVTVPEGCVAMAKGPYRALKEEVELKARHGYQAGVLLVPGVPEATSLDNAIAAVVGFVAWARNDRARSMWRCPGQVQDDLHRLVKGEKEVNETTFQPGDAVSYVVSKKTGRGYSFSARKGTLVEINGGLAIVRARNGKEVAVRVEGLRAADQPNALTEGLAVQETSS